MTFEHTDLLQDLLRLKDNFENWGSQKKKKKEPYPGRKLTLSHVWICGCAADSHVSPDLELDTERVLIVLELRLWPLDYRIIQGMQKNCSDV